MTTATVACRNGRQVEFVGSIYGGPVVIVTVARRSPPTRGELGPEWVRRFF
jgi:hypothetical protein